MSYTARSNKDGTEGEFKVYGRAREVNDPDEWRKFGDAVYAAIGMRIEDTEGHCFAIEIESVVFSQLCGEEFHWEIWSELKGQDTWSGGAPPPLCSLWRGSVMGSPPFKAWSG